MALETIAFLEKPPSGNGNYAMTLLEGPDRTGQLATGALVLVQRVLLGMFTQLGSMAYLPSAGSSFATRLQFGQFASEYDLFTAFTASTRQVKSALQAEESATDPIEERLQDLKLQKLILAPGGVIMTLAITSQSGALSTLSVPVELSF